MATIYTSEVITDSAAYAASVLPELDKLHAALYEKTGGRGPLKAAVCAENVDILVKEDFPSSFGDPDVSYETPIFGDLYPLNKSTFKQGGKSYIAFTHLSATATNAMLEDVGLKPGEDVAKFELVKNGNFTYPLIHGLMSDGKHGVSADPIFMGHDRHQIHAPGVLTMHPEIFRRAREAARSTDPHSEKGQQIASDYHDATFLLTALANRVYANDSNPRREVLRTPIFGMNSSFTRFLPLGRLPIINYGVLGSLQADNYARLEELVTTYRHKAERS